MLDSFMLLEPELCTMAWENMIISLQFFLKMNPSTFLFRMEKFGVQKKYATSCYVRNFMKSKMNAVRAVKVSEQRSHLFLIREEY